MDSPNSLISLLYTSTPQNSHTTQKIPAGEEDDGEDTLATIDDYMANVGSRKDGGTLGFRQQICEDLRESDLQISGVLPASDGGLTSVEDVTSIPNEKGLTLNAGVVLKIAPQKLGFFCA
ncbi:UNVERIFIED_CONTAM: hypothetical protein Sindi_3028600 [Sesamum indicum]